jgi:hypothetical protein
MVLSNVDLLSKLMSLPPEARQELFGLLEDPEAPSFEETAQAILERLSGVPRETDSKEKG